jgi:hypothetical protein
LTAISWRTAGTNFRVVFLFRLFPECCTSQRRKAAKLSAPHILLWIQKSKKDPNLGIILLTSREESI